MIEFNKKIPKNNVLTIRIDDTLFEMLKDGSENYDVSIPEYVRGILNNHHDYSPENVEAEKLIKRIHTLLNNMGVKKIK